MHHSICGLHRQFCQRSIMCTPHLSQVPHVSGIVERLLIFLESHCEAVVSEALVCMKDLLRRFPEMAEVVVAQVMAAVTQGTGNILPATTAEPQAKAALLWIMGQFGQHIPVGTAHDMLVCCIQHMSQRCVTQATCSAHAREVPAFSGYMYNPSVHGLHSAKALVHFNVSGSSSQLFPALWCFRMRRICWSPWRSRLSLKRTQ